MSTTDVFTNAIILPVNADQEHSEEWFEGWLEVTDGRISGIGEGRAPTPRERNVAVHDVQGAFLAPGFVSGHSHIFTGGMRGVAASSPLYAWVSQNGRMLAGADAETLYWLSRAGGVDHLSAGVTSVYNFTQSRVVSVFDYDTSTLRAETVKPVEFVFRQIDGVADSGIRFVTSVRLDDEQLPENDAFDGFDAVMNHLDSVAPEQNLGGSVYGAVQWSSAAITAHREKSLMTRYGITNQAHFVETAEQIEIQQAKFDWYDDAGVLGKRFAFGHFVHPTDRMVDRVAESGTSVVWQPMSNGRLGSGIADIPALLRRSVTVGIGVDDQSCTDLTDPFENMRHGLFTQRAAHSDAALLTPADVLRAHTLGSAQAIGVADRVGSLEVGKFADFVIVDPRRPDTGPIWDPVATYVLACGQRNLREVYVGGQRMWPAADELLTELREHTHTRMVASAAVAGVRPAVAR
ncbi:MAG: amidohydrolase family protein [Gordonia sp. (in: high G+C Gram-positive bacteria)]